MARPFRGPVTVGLSLALAASAALAQIGDMPPPEVNETWVLVPNDAEHEVPVEGTVRLHLRKLRCIQWAEGLESCIHRKPDMRGLAVAWTVNGHMGGAPGIGRVRTFQDRFNTGGDVSMGLDIDDVVYVAPDKVPSPNPVAVAAVIGDMDRKEQVQVVTHVKVVDTPGWRGSFTVQIRATRDPYGGLPTRTAAENPIFWIQERSLFDKNNDIDLITIDSQLVYTVTGVVSEAYEDNGSGIVILETRPQGSLNYFHRVNRYCDFGLTVASGERDEIYLSTPLYVTVLLKADGSSIVKAIPNVAFDVDGYHWWEDCQSGFTERYETFFDGQLIDGEVIDAGVAPDHEAPRRTINQRLVGAPGDGRSFLGEARVPVALHFGDDDVPGEAYVSWRLSRKK